VWAASRELALHGVVRQPAAAYLAPPRRIDGAENSAVAFFCAARLPATCRTAPARPPPCCLLACPAYLPGFLRNSKADLSLIHDSTLSAAAHRGIAHSPLLHHQPPTRLATIRTSTPLCFPPFFYFRRNRSWARKTHFTPHQQTWPRHRGRPRAPPDRNAVLGILYNQHTFSNLRSLRGKAHCSHHTLHSYLLLLHNGNEGKHGTLDLGN
jgi:hypothetical protein